MFVVLRCVAHFMCIQIHILGQTCAYPGALLDQASQRSLGLPGLFRVPGSVAHVCSLIMEGHR